MRKNIKNTSIKNNKKDLILKEALSIFRILVFILISYWLGNCVMGAPSLWYGSSWIYLFINPYQLGVIFALPLLLILITLFRLILMQLNKLLSPKWEIYGKRVQEKLNRILIIKYSVNYFILIASMTFTYLVMINNLSWISIPTGWLFGPRPYSSAEFSEFSNSFLSSVVKIPEYIAPSIESALLLYLPFLLMLIIFLGLKRFYLKIYGNKFSSTKKIKS